MNSRVSIVRCKTYNREEVVSSIERAIEFLGGISKYVKDGETILLKPNILSARPPESGVDTHPEVVGAVARIVRQAGAKIIVGDSPGGYGFKDAGSTYEASGIKRMCEEEGIELVEFDRAQNIGGIPLVAYAKEVDALISIPKMKTHNLMTITGAVKNSFGLAVGLYKTDCHLKAPGPKDFAGYLVDVFECARPRLVIIDGIVAMEGEGPAAGDLRDSGLILASDDCVACDAVFADLIGIPALSIWTTSEAYRRHLGEADLSKIEVLGVGLKDAKLHNFKLPKTSIMAKIPRPIFKLIAAGIKFWPAIADEVCKRCQICAKSCPAGCITINEEGSKIDCKKCVSCFCCFELCPHGAISIKRSLLARMLERT